MRAGPVLRRHWRIALFVCGFSSLWGCNDGGIGSSWADAMKTGSASPDNATTQSADAKKASGGSTDTAASTATSDTATPPLLVVTARATAKKSQTSTHTSTATAKNLGRRTGTSTRVASDVGDDVGDGGHDLTGVWDAKGYSCLDESSNETVYTDEVLQITQIGTDLTAKKLVGDKCMGAGHVSFTAKVKGADLHVRLFGSPPGFGAPPPVLANVKGMVMNGNVIVINLGPAAPGQPEQSLRLTKRVGGRGSQATATATSVN